MMRRCLTHDLDPYEAFYFLTDEFGGTGGWYWWKVPELAESNHHQLSSKQNVTISAKNCPTGFEDVVQELRRLT